MATTTSYDKCIAALQSHQSHRAYVCVFKNWCKEDEFEEEDLIDEFLNNNAEQSFFVEYLLNNRAINEQEASAIFNTLHSCLCVMYCSKQTAYILISYHMKQHSFFMLFPHEIIKLCVLYLLPSRWQFQRVRANKFVLPPLTICTNVSAREMAKALYHEQCSIMPLIDEILDMFIIGIFNNELPLLTYLVDAFNRYRIDLSVVKKKYRVKLKDFPADSFIKKVCRKGFGSFSLRGQTLKFINKFVDAIEYVTNWRHLGKALINTKDSIYVIQDTMAIYRSFICECFTAIHRYITQNVQRMPCQIDISIIPRALCSRGIDDDSDGDNDNDARHAWDVDDELNDLHRSFRLHNIHYISQYLESYDCSQWLHDSIESILHNKSHQRCCVLLDRYDDNLFVYQPPEAGRLRPYDDEFVNESLIDNSIRYMIPNFSSVGIKEEHLFSVSFHCMSANDVRTYLFIEGFCTRFSITDFDVYLRNFFTSGGDDQRVSDRHKNMFISTRFDAFYGQMVDEDYKASAGDERMNVVVKVRWVFDMCEPLRFAPMLYLNHKGFVLPKNEDAFDHMRTVEMYTLSSRLPHFRFTKGSKYHFQIKCKRHKTIRLLQQTQEIYGVGFGIRDDKNQTVYVFEDGDVKINDHVHETVNQTKQWKYGQDIRMEIDCTDYVAVYLCYFVDYKRVQTKNLSIEHFYEKRFYPFLRSNKDNIVFEII